MHGQYRKGFIRGFKEKLTKAYEEKVGKTPEFYVVSIGDGPSRLI